MKAKAEEFQAQGDENRAALYMQVASLYYQAADLNSKIYFALARDRNGKAFTECIAELKKIENKYAELTRQKMKRTWLMPDEYQAYLDKIAAMLDKRRQNR